ncbi:hypothetical protein BGW80DRAFT_878247 [Lactifluus volemus]|nr:hypothetical protein BGW80DRAFT_878247 [Lactifluus volemus]
MGVSHRDFEPRNVLRKRWCNFEVTNFALSNTAHNCPGWGSCQELRTAWYGPLELGSLPFKSTMLAGGAGCPCSLWLVSFNFEFINYFTYYGSNSPTPHKFS